MSEHGLARLELHIARRAYVDVVGQQRGRFDNGDGDLEAYKVCNLVQSVENMFLTSSSGLSELTCITARPQSQSPFYTPTRAVMKTKSSFIGLVDIRDVLVRRTYDELGLGYINSGELDPNHSPACKAKPRWKL